MPLIHIYLNEGKSAEYRSAVSDALHQAFLETWNIPLKDRFHIFHETKPGDLQIDKEMWDVERSDDNIVFHVFTSPRTTAMKLAFYERLPQILEEKVALRPDDVFVSLAQNTREDWSFGKGEAQLLATQGQASPEALAAPSSATSRATGSAGHRCSRRSLAAVRSARLPRALPGSAMEPWSANLASSPRAAPAPFSVVHSHAASSAHHSRSERLVAPPGQSECSSPGVLTESPA